MADEQVTTEELIEDTAEQTTESEPALAEESSDEEIIDEDYDDSAEEYFDDPDTDIDEATDFGTEEISFSEGLDPEAVEVGDSAELFEQFMYQGTEAAKNFGTSSVKGTRLTGNNLTYYNYFKSIINNVSAAKQSDTTKTVSLTKIAGKRKFTAKELGLKRIGYKKGGKWYVDSKAMKKITALIAPQDWKKVYQALSCDLSSNGYWCNWYSGDMKYDWNAGFNYNTKTFTFKKGTWISFKMPVIPEYAKNSDATHKYIYVADLSKIKATSTARNNAKAIVKNFDEMAATAYAGYSNEMLDYMRLAYYCDKVDYLTEYDKASAALSKEERYWRGPWEMMYVFDEDPNTMVVCAGYAKAFKYLCDLSKFRSSWIDCQVITGSAGSGENSDHMWNIVRMNDGLNYVVDPTWTDKGTYADLDNWFLRGAPTGTADSYTIAGNTRVYDAYTKSVFAPAERKLSTKDKYTFVTDRKITLKATKIKKLTKAKKAFTVKWSKVATPLGALYIDGYQIQYSLKNNFKSAKTVTVNGYASASKKIIRFER